MEGTWDQLDYLRQERAPATAPAAAPAPQGPLPLSDMSEVPLGPGVWDALTDLDVGLPSSGPVPRHTRERGLPGLVGRVSGGTLGPAGPVGPPDPNARKRMEAQQGVEEAAAKMIGEVGARVQSKERELAPVLASGDPETVLQTVKAETDVMGLPNETAKAYRRTGRDPDKDFQSIIEAYGLSQADTPSEENITIANMDENERAAFLFDMGLKAMAMGGQPGSENMTLLAILGGAALESLKEVRERRRLRGQERRELGKLLLQERQFQGRLNEQRADRALATARLDEERRHNKALEAYRRQSLRAGGPAQLTADMGLLQFFVNTYGEENKLKAIEEAKKFKHGGRYASGDVTINRAADETARKMFEAEMEDALRRGESLSPDEKIEVYKKYYTSVKGQLEGKKAELGFTPPTSIEDLMGMSREQIAAWSDVTPDDDPLMQQFMTYQIAAPQ